MAAVHPGPRDRSPPAAASTSRAAGARVGARIALTQPDILVLGGGGILGEAWMNAVLAGLEDANGVDCTVCRGYGGTSAGSIVAAALAAGLRPASRLGRLPEQPPLDEAAIAPSSMRRAFGVVAGAGGAAAAPLASLALRAAAPGGAVLRRAALARVPDGRRPLRDLGRTIDEMGVEWDGRLQVSAVDLATGRRVMFGAPGAPAVTVSQAVQASCAIPGVFRPLEADGRRYVDGGAWSPTNMDAAPAARGDVVLCLNPTGSLRREGGLFAGVVGPVSRSVAGAEAFVLRRRGALVTTVSPDARSGAAMGRNLMDPAPRQEVIAAGLAQGRALARV